MARAFGQRPSSLLDLAGDPLLAYAIDETLFVRLRFSDAETPPGAPAAGGKGGRGMPTREELMKEAFDPDVPVIGDDGQSRYFSREEIERQVREQHEGQN